MLRQTLPRLMNWYLLLVLVKDFDDKRYQLPQLDPIEVIKYKMQEMGIKAKDL